MPLGHECNVVPGYYLYNLVTKHNFHTGNCDETRLVFRNTMSDFHNHPELWAGTCPYTLKEGDFVEPCIVKNSATETLAAIQEYVDNQRDICTANLKDPDGNEYWTGYWEGVKRAIIETSDILNKGEAE